MFPKILYKYRSWDNPNHKKIIANNKIFFCSAKKFNDPFDATIPVRYDRSTKEQRYHYYLKHTSKVFQQLDQSKIQKIAAECLERGYFHQSFHQKWLRFFHQQKRFKDFGIFSLTGSRNNLVMWSHYSDAHRGFCVGFDTNKLLKHFEKGSKAKRISCTLHKVKYEKKYPLFKPTGLSADDFAIEPLITKSSHWEYENEYRLILMTESNKSIQLEDGIIVKVILGCKMPSEHIKEIKKALMDKSQPIALYEAKLKAEDFELEFHEIEY